MAKLLQPSPARRPLSNTVRVWWALRSQKRRRKGAGVSVAPVITNGWVSWGDTQEGWADVYLEFTFDQGNLPAATFEVWRSAYWDGRSAVLLGTVPSTLRSYHDSLAADVESNFVYAVRYLNGSVVGPFSNWYEISLEFQ